MADSLQSQLDNITAQTRTLVQADRLAVTDTAVQELLGTGIESRVLSAGAKAPVFALPDAINGKMIRSEDLLAVGPLVVKFFRGRWCPYDMTELEAWQRLYADVRAKGALLVGISPQLQRQNDFTVQHHGLRFPILTDTAAMLATEFGLTYQVSEVMQKHYRSILINIPFIHGNQGDNTWRLPLPGTFVISQGGEVVYSEAHADHRVRPDPTDALAAL